MNNINYKGWFKSLFESKSRRSNNGCLSVEHLEVRLTPDAKTVPAFHNLPFGISENNCAANSITLIDDIRLQQNATDYRSSQVYFSSNNSPNFSASAFQLVHKLDAIALQAASTKGVVLIDSSLIATIPVDELKGSLVVSIDGNSDVVSQITTALDGISNVPVLRIISHGNDGVLYFGNQAFDSTVLTASAMQVASWGKSLTADADILLYGCSVANTDAGKAFVEQFASITQADIGASTNLTGKAGDEVLEFQVGQVSNALIASAINYESANLTLAQFTVITTADSGPGSLRQSIIDSNATSANDEIIFASALFTNGAITTITLQTALPSIATTSSAGSLTITGSGASALTVSGDNGDTNRNFNIFNIDSGGNLTISGVTVSGAKTTSFGGAFNNSGILNIANSTLSNNSATFGGAIENISGAILTVTNSTIFGNSASFGGGIDNYGGTLTVIGSTLSSNTATYSGGGGGIYSSSSSTITNTIIANSIGGDFAGSAPTTSTNNFITSGTLSGATTVTSQQLNLGPLQDNGGPTFTIALGAGSVAIGAGNAIISNAAPINGLDQRGVTRSSTAPSVGAYEGIATAPTVTLNTANLASNAATLTIAGTGFNTIAASNTVTLSSGTGTVTSATANLLTITFTTLPSASGSLTAIITSFGSTSGSPVQVGTLVAAPSGTSFGTAIALNAVTGGFGADGIISVAGEADYYTFTATATGVVNFAMAAINNSGVDSILTIYDSSFVQIARNDDSNGTLNSFVSLNVTAGSVYYIKATAYVSSIAGATGATGAYRVSATPIAAAGASFGTAIALTAQQGSTVASYDGVINPALESDFYTYTATSTGVVNFAMAAINNSGVDSILTIYDSSFVQIARNDDSNGTLNSFISLNVTANAIYYLKATAYGLGTGAYRVSATVISAPINAPVASGDSFATSITLTASSSNVASANGEINPAYNADYYTYTAAATGVVNFAMAAINNSGVDSILTIYDSSFVQIARNDDSNGTLNSFISLNVTAGSVYFLKATAFGSGTGAYQVSATFIPAPTSGQPSAPGDSFANAITLTAPQGSTVPSAIGDINPAYNADYYKYIATTTGVVNFAMAAINNSGVDSYLTLYNSNLVEIARNDDSNGTLNSFISLNVTANTIYYLKATAYGLGTGAYQVSATVISAPTVPGISFATAITLTAGNPIAGDISTALESAFYTYTATATGVVNFAMAAINNSGVDSILTIYDSSFVQIARNDDSNGTLNSFISLNVTAGSVYFLKATAFGSGTGAYQVSATFIALTTVTNGGTPGDSFTNAITISASVIDPIASYDGEINPAFNADYYKYIATTTGVINFAMAAINNSGVDSILTIYDSSFVQIARNDDSNGTLNSFISLNVTANAIYYLKATAYGSGTGAYRVSASSGSVFNSTPPGATFGTAINLTVGDPIEGVISNPFEADYYKYIATATGVIDFAINAISNSGVDTFLTIYNSEFIEIAHDDDSGSGLNSLASISVNANVIYYIKASAYGSDTGAYRISANNSDNQNTSPGASFATAINLTRAAPITGTISTALEADYYKYLATATGGVIFEMTATSNPGVDTFLTIYNSNFIEIAQDDDSGTGLNSLVSISVSANAIYYLKATAYGSGTGAYQVSATVQTNDDVGGSLDATATPLSFTGNVASESKTIGVASDVDVFRLTADVEGVYEIAVSPANASALAPVIEVIGNDGTTLLEFSSSNAGVAAFALPFLTLGQQVYVRVSGAGSTGDYTLEVTKPATATDYIANIFNPLPMLQPVDLITLSPGTNSGSLTNNRMDIESATDVDVFSFTTNRSGPIQVSVSKAVGSNLDTIVSILDASGNVFEFNDDSNGTTNSTVVFQANNNTLYYIRVSGYGGTIGRFDISVTDLTPTVAETDGAGTDLTHATALTVDVPRTGNISSAGDQDFFSITASSSGVLTISLAAGVGSGLDTYLYLYNSDKVLILEDDNSGSDLNSLISTNVVNGQTYYLQASGFGFSTGAYTISASISAADDHANQAGESATRLVVSSTNAVSNTAGTINPSTDNDVFLFKATADGSITINVTPTNNSTLNSYLFVYDSTGNILLAYNDGNSSTDRTSRISLQVVRDAVYYFMVSGASGTTGAYTISVTPVTDTVGNTIALATNLPISTTSTDNTTVGTVNGSIGSNGDLDFYKVAINRSGRYAFSASANPTSNGLDTTIAVYSENGQLLGENDDASASSLNSSLSLNLTAGEIVYVRVAGYGESTGDYIFNVVYISPLITAPIDDFGGTIDDAYSFVLDNTHSYTASSANIQFAGDVDVFHGRADISGNITLVLTPSANLQGNIRAFVTRNGENIQVGSVNGNAVGGVVNLTFPVSASENFYIEISGNNSTTGTYRLSVNNVIATNTVRPTDGSVIDRIAEELREEFTRIIAAASANADINATSQVIMTQLLAVIQRLIPGFTGFVGFFDPVDLNLTTPNGGGTIGSQGNNSTNSNPSASLSSRGALDLVVIPGAAAGQYNLNMSGVGSSAVHAGVVMVGANGQVINPTITGGQSSGGIAASNVPKTGLNLVLDFGSNSGGGNGGGGNGGNGNRGDTAQSGPVAGSTTASASASASSSSASSSTASAATGLTSLAALANAITQSATASGAGSTTSAASLANLASLALGLGSTAATLDEKQLAKDLGGDAPAGELDLSSLNTVKTLSDFVTITFAQAYKGFNQAVFSTLDAEKQVVSEIANIFDKVLPALVPSEFENAVENLLVQTKKSLLEDARATLLKTGDILADIIMSKLVKNLPAAQPAKNKVDAKVPSFEFVIANFVQQNKNDSAAEENCFGEHTAITEKVAQCFEEIFNSVNRNALDDSLTGPSILLNDQQNKAAEALGVIAGVLLAPGFLSSTNGTQAPAFEKPKPRKQKS